MKKSFERNTVLKMQTIQYTNKTPAKNVDIEITFLIILFVSITM